MTNLKRESVNWTTYHKTLPGSITQYVNGKINGSNINRRKKEDKGESRMINFNLNSSAQKSK